MLLLNLSLALMWCALTGNFSFVNLASGFALGYVVIVLVRPSGESDYGKRVLRVIGLTIFVLRELFVATLRVAHDIVTPRHYMRPAVVALPLDAHTDAQITLLANLLTLTPGSLSVEVSADRRVLYVHFMYVDDLEETRRYIKQQLERRIMEVTE